MGIQTPTSHPFGQATVWPEHVPANLRLRLLDSLSYANVSVDDLWDEIHEWLTEQDAKPGMVPGRRLEPLVLARPIKVQGSQKHTDSPR